MVSEPNPVGSLLILSGQRAGEKIELYRGRLSIGRHGDAALVINDAGVSRQHAEIDVREGRTVLTDLDSSNGTWVNGAIMVSAQTLSAGDAIQMGSVIVRYDQAPVPRTEQARDPVSTASPEARRIRLGRPLLIGAASELILLGAGVVIAFLTEWTGFGPLLGAPLLGMVVALIGVLKQYATAAPAPARAPPQTVQRTQGRTSLGVGLLLTVALIGGGGVALAVGVGYVTGIVTGNETGTERLSSGPVAADNAGVIATVHSVEQTAHFTRVSLMVENRLANSLNLPLFSNCSISAPDGNTLDADAFRSSWNPSIAAGASRSGVFVFPGHLPAQATTAVLNCANVYEQGFTGPDSLTVPGIELRPMDD